MWDLLEDVTLGAVLVATGVLIGWFAVTLESPTMGAIGAVFAVLGIFVAGLEILNANRPEASARVHDGTPGISLSSAPESVREDVPASSKLVWMYLAAEGESTLDEIVDGTQLTQRTARNAIIRLEEVEVVTKRPADQGSGICYDVGGCEEAMSATSENV